MAFDLRKGNKFAGKGKEIKPGQLGESYKKELSDLEKSYRDRAAQEKKRFVDVTDSEYWFTVCFHSRKDCEAFLKAAGVIPNLHGDKYLSGYELATLLGLEVDFD